MTIDPPRFSILVSSPPGRSSREDMQERPRRTRSLPHPFPDTENITDGTAFDNMYTAVESQEDRKTSHRSSPPFAFSAVSPCDGNWILRSFLFQAFGKRIHKGGNLWPTSILLEIPCFFERFHIETKRPHQKMCIIKGSLRWNTSRSKRSSVIGKVRSFPAQNGANQYGGFYTT